MVHETPGVTRDRKEIEVEWTGHRLLLVDTGGYDTTEDAPFAGHIREQVGQAIASADAVLFVLDGRTGPLADDYGIADVLRRAKAPVIVVANKMDDPASTVTAREIYALGLGEPCSCPPCTARAAASCWTASSRSPERSRAAARKRLRARRRRRRWPSSVVPMPASRRCSTPSRARSAPSSARSPAPRATLSTASSRPRAGRFRFIDTAGMRKAAKVSGVEYYSYLRSVQSLDRAHVAIIVVDATMRFGELDLSICTEATRRDCATVIAVNKCDIARAGPGRDRRHRPAQAPPAAAGDRRLRETRRGIRELLAKVAELDALYTAHISTRALNRALAELAADRAMPQKHGKRLKMYYIAQFGTSPPRFAIEINDRTLITRDFGFYVENRLRAQFGLEGVPLVIDFKGKR